MTQKEAESWVSLTSKEKLVEMAMEHRTLKQLLCAQKLGIPTGADDWISRAVREVNHLQECKRQLHKVISGTVALLEEANFRSQDPICFNCQGGKTVNGESCCICGGTGAKQFIPLTR